MNVLDEKIEKSQSICILGHISPDGDCIGAVLSLYNYIIKKYKDKNVKPYLQVFSEKYLILPNASKISHDDNDAIIYDLCIIVDCGNDDRLKEFARYHKEAKDTIVFDHHENNRFENATKIVRDDSVATCEILYDYIDKDYIDKDIATCLYIGIATDSGVFRYRALTKKTLLIVSELIEYGFDFTKLLDTIVFNNTLAQRKAQALVFDRLKLYKEGTISYSYILEEEIANLHITKNELDNIIVYLREIDKVKVAAFAYPIGHVLYKLSLRSTTDSISVADFAVEHEGGGHALASGCVYHGNIESVTKNFIKDMTDYIDKCN